MHKKGTEERSDENKRYPCPHDRQTGFPAPVGSGQRKSQMQSSSYSVR